MTDQVPQNVYQEPKIWIERWAAAFWIADQLLKLNQNLGGDIDNEAYFQAVRMRAAKAASKIAEPPQDLDVGLSAAQIELIRMARQLLLFSQQQLAFLIDSLHSHLYFSVNFQASAPLGVNNDRERRLTKRMAEIGDPSQISYTLADYALRRVITQTSTDVVNLHNIWNQYSAHESSVVKEKIEQGNVLAAEISVALQDYLPTRQQPLTYVRQSSGTRLIPYSSVPLIAIPASALAVAADYLAIPHEFGHFLYWRGRHHTTVDGEEISILDELENVLNPKGLPNWIQPWIEEIFADVVGALIGGPAAVLSLMEMMLEKVGDLFLKDDGHYPIPAVRPYVALAVLKALKGGQTDHQLAQHWRQILCVRLGKGFESVPLPWPKEKVPAELAELTVSAIEQKLSEVTNKILSLFPDRFQRDGETAIPWTPVADVDNLDALYSIFQEKLEAPTSGHPVAGDAAGTEAYVQNWIDIILPYLEPPTKEFLKDLRDRSTHSLWDQHVLDVHDGTGAGGAQPCLDILPIEWFSILYLGGWGDAGPTGGSPHVT